MSEFREWYPTDWVDEVCPPSKGTPEAFIIIENGKYVLGYAPGDRGVDQEDRALFNQPLAIGDVINFVSCDRYDDVEATLRRDGSFDLHGALLPPEHNTIIVDGDIDTLQAGFDALIAEIKNPGDEFHVSHMIFEDGENEKRVTLSLARWSDSLPHRFDINDGKPVFRQMQLN